MSKKAQSLFHNQQCCDHLDDKVIHILNSSFLQGSNFTNCLNESRLLQIVQQYTNQTFMFPTSTVITLVIAYCVVVVLGLLGNLLVIIVIFRKKVSIESLIKRWIAPQKLTILCSRPFKNIHRQQ